jgi:hypothetical protein
MKLRQICIPFSALALCAAPVVATPAIVQPTNAQSKDAFVYQFLSTFNFNSGGFSALLSTGQSGAGHDTKTAIQFDLTGLSLDAGEKATLNLWSTSNASLGFNQDPSPANPVTTNVFAAASAWDANTINWNNVPATTTATPLSQGVVDGINEWVSIDVTNIVQGWLANPASNNGFVLTQDALVAGGQVVAVYDSAAAQNRPFLQIQAVPEPATLGLAVLSLPLLLRRRRRAV